MSELEGTKKAAGDRGRSPADRARAVRRRRRALVVAAVVLAAVGVASWVLIDSGRRPSPLVLEARRQVDGAVLRAASAAAEVVLADVRAEVAGPLRPDELRARASDAIDRVRSAVAPLKGSERVSADELDAGIDEVARLLRAGDPAVGEALAALERLAAEAVP